MQQNLTKIYILLFLFQSFAKHFAVFLKDIAMCFILGSGYFTVDSNLPLESILP